MPHYAYRRKRKYKRRGAGHHNRRYSRGRYNRGFGVLTAGAGRGLGSLFGNRKLVKLRYHATLTLEPNAPFVAAYVFSANGLFDPDITGTGHQPRGFDEIMPLFFNYVVVQSTLSASFLQTANNTADDSLGTQVGIALKGVDTVSTLSNSYFEDRNVVFTTLGNRNASGPVFLSNTFNARKYLTRKDPLNDDTLQGNGGANPDEQVFYQIFIAPLQDIGVGIIQITVDIVYTAVFIGPQIPPES